MKELLKKSKEQEVFENFVAAAGSLKKMQEKMRKSYPYEKKMLSQVLMKRGMIKRRYCRNNADKCETGRKGKGGFILTKPQV